MARHVEEELDALFSALVLRDDWQQAVMNLFVENPDVQVIVKERERVREQLRRCVQMYRDLVIDEAQYKSDLDRFRNKLMSLQVPDVDEAMEAGEFLKDFSRVWTAATKGEQNELLRTALDAIYVDGETKRINSIQPKPPFATILTTMAERADLKLEEVPDFPFLVGNR